MPESCNILGVDIAVTNMKSVCYYLTKNLERIRGEYVCVSNVHTTVMAYNDASYREVQNNAVIAVPDGKPLSLICRIRGYKAAQRSVRPFFVYTFTSNYNANSIWYYNAKSRH